MQVGHRGHIHTGQLQEMSGMSVCVRPDPYICVSVIPHTPPHAIEPYDLHDSAEVS